MDVQIWGARGSVPSPGPATSGYGGNTPSLSICLSDGSLVILDAGTGIRALGLELGACRATVLLSHYHWDHIQGLPFFSPMYMAASELRILGPRDDDRGPYELIAGQLAPPYFPVTLDACLGISECYSVHAWQPFHVGSALVTPARLSHPNTTFGYRIEDAGSTLVYMSDNEPDQADPETRASITALARGADVLFHDCQYSEEEYVYKQGWGHSTPRQAVGIALDAGVKSLVLFHHDPEHSDRQVEALAAEARWLAPELPIRIAREGETISVAAPSRAA